MGSPPSTLRRMDADACPKSPQHVDERRSRGVQSDVFDLDLRPGQRQRRPPSERCGRESRPEPDRFRAVEPLASPDRQRSKPVTSDA